jgi:hypothetical protein
MSQSKTTITITLPDGSMAMDRLTYEQVFQAMIKNIEKDNLILLAEKSKKPRINEKIRQYKNLI